MLTAVALGFLLGLRHAFDPDHVIAVSTIVSRQRSPWTATWVGISWGLGHSATILVVGCLVVALQIAIPEGLARSLEFGIGALLVALGITNLLAATPRRWSLRRSTRDEPLVAALRRSGLVGLCHGLAGSAAIALLAMAAMPSPGAAFLYLGVFALGTVGGMVACSLAVGAPLALLPAGGGWPRFAIASTGLVSLVFGAHLLYEIGFVQGWTSLT